MQKDYHFKEDVESILDIKKISIDYFCNECDVPKRTLFYSFSHVPSNNVLENAYSLIYKLGFRMSQIKSEMFQESLKENEILLFHGSKQGIDKLTFNGSRSDCDFGAGFYLTPMLSSAISFVNIYPSSSIYVFKCNLEGLKIYNFECDLEWMLLISLYRGKINGYINHKKISSILNKIKDADIIVGPIADNKMFEVMSKFASGDITSIEALHSLSASRLGKQFVIKTEKGIKSLQFLDRFYLCQKEREQSLEFSKEQELLIQNKLDFSKRNFKGQGEYIDEVLK